LRRRGWWEDVGLILTGIVSGRFIIGAKNNFRQAGIVWRDGEGNAFSVNDTLREFIKCKNLILRIGIFLSKIFGKLCVGRKTCIWDEMKRSFYLLKCDSQT